MHPPARAGRPRRGGASLDADELLTGAKDRGQPAELRAAMVRALAGLEIEQRGYGELSTLFLDETEHPDVRCAAAVLPGLPAGQQRLAADEPVHLAPLGRRGDRVAAGPQPGADRHLERAAIRRARRGVLRLRRKSAL